MKDGVKAKQYVDLEVLTKQLKNIEQSMQVAQQEIDHALLTQNMMNQLKNAKKDTELLIPLGSGTFCTVKADAIDQVKMSVGAGVLVDRSPEDAHQGLSDQIKQLKAQRDRSDKLYDQLIDKIVALQRDIEGQVNV